MTEKELEILINLVEWETLGSGKYNHARISTSPFTINGYTGYWVEKEPINISEKLSHKTRALRKWHLINPQYPAYLTLRGWLMPYIGPAPIFSREGLMSYLRPAPVFTTKATYSSDDQRADKVVQIYQKTGNLIYDGSVLSNFIVFNHEDRENTQEDVLVDVDFALEVGSVVSDEYYQYDDDENFIAKCKQEDMPKTATIIETVRYLEKQLPKEHIQRHRITRPIWEKLHVFCAHKWPITQKALNFFLDLVDVDASNEFQLDIFLNQLMLHEQFIVYTAPLTKQQLAEIIIHYFLEEMGQHEEQQILNTLRVALTYQPSYQNKQNQRGYTLLHLATIHHYQSLIQYLISIGVDISIKTPPNNMDTFNNANMNAFEIALIAQMPSYILSLFQTMGSKDLNQIEAMNRLLPNEQWSSSSTQTETLRLLSQALHQLSESNDASLLIKSNPNLWTKITHNSKVLTWSIHRNGYTTLHYLFKRKNQFLINSIMQWPEWATLRLVCNLKNQHTLFDFIALHGELAFYDELKSLASTSSASARALRLAVESKQFDFCKRLLMDGVDPNDIPPHHCPLLFVAAQNGDEKICTLLFTYGANPNVLWRGSHLTVDDWKGEQDNNPIDHFAYNLYQLIHNPESFTPQDYSQWIDHLHQYPWFLIWSEKYDGVTFLEDCFSLNQTAIINPLLNHPQCNTFIKQKSMHLFEKIAEAGHITYYEQLKPPIDQKPHYTNTLISATSGGHVQFCQLLLEDGADFHRQVNDNQTQTNTTFHEYWEKYHPDKENPFTHYLWKHKKQQCLEILEEESASYGVSKFHFFNIRRPLKQCLAILCSRISQLSFDSQKNIDEQLGEVFALFKEDMHHNTDLLLTKYDQQIIHKILKELHATCCISNKPSQSILDDSGTLLSTALNALGQWFPS